MAKKRKKIENNDAPQVNNEDSSSDVAAVNSDDLLALLELNPEGALIIDPESREVFLANQAAERLLKKKMAKIFAEPFTEELQDGPMKTMDLHMKVHTVNWQGQEARYVVLHSLASQQSAFHVEWRIEAAEERARDAETRVAELEALVQRPAEVPAEVSGEKVEELHRQVERGQELSHALTARVSELEASVDELTLLKEASEASQEALQSELEAARELLTMAGEQESSTLETARQLEKARLSEQEARTQATQAHDENNELHGQIAHLEGRLTQLEAEFLDAERRAVAAETHAREAETLMEEAELQAQETERHLEDLTDSVRQVEEKLEETTAALRLEQTEHAALKVEIEALRQQLEGNEYELEAARSLVESATGEQQTSLLQLEQIEQLQEQLRTLQEEGGQAHLLLEEASQRTLRLDEEVEQLKAERDQAGQETQAAKTRLDEELARFNEEIEDWKTRLAEVEAQYTEMQELQVHDLAAQHKSELDALNSEVEGLRVQVEQSHAQSLELEQLQAQLHELAPRASEADQLAADLIDLNSQMTEIRQRAEVAELQAAELDYLRAQLDGLRSQSEEAEGQQVELERLQAEVGELQSRLQASSSERNDEIEALKTQVEGLSLQEEEIKRLEAALAQAQNHAAEAEQRAAELEELIEVAEEKAEHSVDDLNAQQALATQHNLELDNLRAQLQSVTDELANFRQQAVAGADQEHSHLLEQVANLQTDLEQRQRELDQQLQEHLICKGRLQDTEVALEQVASDLEESRALLERQSKQELSQHEMAAEATEQLHEQLLESQSQLSALQGQLTQAEAQRVLAEEKASQSESRASEIEAQVENLRQELGKAQSQTASVATEAPAVDPETEALAFQDLLTGLPNQNLVRRYLEFTLQQVERDQRSCALVHVDLDLFHVVNDTLGWTAGDQLLVQACERLQASVRNTDVLGRRGEDEFYIILSEVSGDPNHPDSAAAVVQRISQLFQAPFEVGGQKFELTASWGVSQYPGDANQVNQMFEHAAVALRRCKEKGRNCTHFYTSALQERFDARAQLRLELRKGIDQNQFQLLYQPIVSLQNGTMVGVESLLRWNHPSYGTLLPEHFLEVAEESGLLVLLGRWILLQACKQSQEWARAGLDIFVSVNLSHREFLQADLVQTVERSLEVMQAPAHSIVFEVPETLQVLDPARTQRVLSQLRLIGVRTALDRFGSGSSRLENLQSESVNFLKIDRRFLTQIPQEASAMRVARAAIQIGKSLGLPPIAVGVESEAQLQFCREVECDFVQGSLVYAPVEPKLIGELYRAGRLLR